MTLKVLWSSLALKDLLEIKEYIQRDNPKAGRLEAKKILKSVERLARFPLSGPQVIKIPSVRQVVSGNYHIYYRLHKSQVEILRVYHGKRDSWV